MKEDFRVFTFGLGSECDKYMITWAAKEGRGYSTIVHDGQNDLNGQVIRSLNMAQMPSLCGAIHGFNGLFTKLDEVFRN